MDFISFCQLFLCAIYCILSILAWKKSKKESEEMSELRSSLYKDQDEYMDMLKTTYGPYIPLPGPTPLDLENNESVKLAWEEFQLVYKIAIPKNDTRILER